MKIRQFAVEVAPCGHAILRKEPKTQDFVEWFRPRPESKSNFDIYLFGPDRDRCS